jgi:chorismate lyase/3-hydroxybenzoate synthase
MVALRPEILSPSSRPLSDDALLSVVRFEASTAPRALVAGGAVELSLPLAGLGGAGVEGWRGAGPGRAWTDGELVLATDGAVLFGAMIDDDADVEAAASRVYAAIIRAARENGFPHLLRVWNHVRGINAPDGGLERYRSFCRGRHDAFAARGYGLRADLPAASAVGMSSGSVATYFVASSEPGQQVENPRQVSAYDYPREYGPRSPSFSRATVTGSLIFISGTASIVGHESKHVGDVDAQLDETLENLARIAAASGATIADFIYLKVYLRNRDDYARVATRLQTRCAAPALFLEADICRADLLLEIEAVAQR